MDKTLHILGWIIGGVVAVIGGALLISGMGLFLGTPVGWLFIPPVVLTIILQQHFANRQRARTILSYLEEGMRAGMPVSGMFASVNRGERDKAIRRVTQKVVMRIGQGDALGDVLADELPELRHRERSLFRAGAHNGRTAMVLRYVVSLLNRTTPRESVMLLNAFVYPLLAAGACLGAMMWISILIIPMHQAILEDMRAQQPLLTHYVWSAGKFIASGDYLVRLVPDALFKAFAINEPAISWLLGVLVPDVLVVVAAGYSLLFALRRGWFEWTLWWLPGSRHMARMRGLSDVCFITLQSLDAGMPLTIALHKAAKLRTNPFLRWRIRKWAQGVESGYSLGLAASRAGLPPMFCGLIGTAEKTGRLPGALDFLHRHYDAQFSRIACVVRGAIGPTLIVLVGVLVAIMILGIYLPFIELMKHGLYTGIVP